MIGPIDQASAYMATEFPKMQEHSAKISPGSWFTAAEIKIKAFLQSPFSKLNRQANIVSTLVSEIQLSTNKNDIANVLARFDPETLKEVSDSFLDQTKASKEIFLRTFLKIKARDTKTNEEAVIKVATLICDIFKTLPMPANMPIPPSRAQTQQPSNAKASGLPTPITPTKEQTEAFSKMPQQPSEPPPSQSVKPGPSRRPPPTDEEVAKSKLPPPLVLSTPTPPQPAVGSFSTLATRHPATLLSQANKEVYALFESEFDEVKKGNELGPKLKENLTLSNPNPAVIMELAIITETSGGGQAGGVIGKFRNELPLAQTALVLEYRAAHIKPGRPQGKSYASWLTSLNNKFKEAIKSSAAADQDQAKEICKWCNAVLNDAPEIPVPADIKIQEGDSPILKAKKACTEVKSTILESLDTIKDSNPALRAELRTLLGEAA